MKNKTPRGREIIPVNIRYQTYQQLSFRLQSGYQSQMYAITEQLNQCLLHILNGEQADL